MLVLDACSLSTQSACVTWGRTGLSATFRFPIQFHSQPLHARWSSGACLLRHAHGRWRPHPRGDRSRCAAHPTLCAAATTAALRRTRRGGDVCSAS